MVRLREATTARLRRRRRGSVGRRRRGLVAGVPAWRRERESPACPVLPCWVSHVSRVTSPRPCAVPFFPSLPPPPLPSFQGFLSPNFRNAPKFEIAPRPNHVKPSLIHPDIHPFVHSRLIKYIYNCIPSTPIAHPFSKNPHTKGL